MEINEIGYVFNEWNFLSEIKMAENTGPAVISLSRQFSISVYKAELGTETIRVYQKLSAKRKTREFQFCISILRHSP